MIYRPSLFFAFANDKAYGGAFLKELDRERKEIERLLTPNPLCELQVRSDASKKRVLDILDKYAGSIRIFHFSGHAAETGIELENYNGESKRALVAGLAPIVAQQKGVRLVFLNGCSTQGQVTSFHKSGIPVVIATTRPVRDTVASEFAQAFYRALNQGKSIKESFDSAEHSILMDYQVEDLYRAMSFGSQKNRMDKHPFELYVSPGKEAVQYESLSHWHEEYEEQSLKPDEDEKPIAKNDYLLCNRRLANKTFGQHFQPEIKKPKLYLLHAPSEEKSESLTQRFLIHSIDQLLEFKKGLSKEKLDVDFPEASDFEHEDPTYAAEVMKQNLANSLRISSRNLTAQRIISRKSNKDVLFIQHFIMEKYWHKDMAAFIQNWYFSFWQEVTLSEKDPYVIILINLIYTEGGRLLGKFFGGKSTAIEKELKHIHKVQPQICLLNKLSPVPKEDVEQWLKKRCPSFSGIGKELFGKKKALPMEIVQHRLIDITREFNERMMK